MIAVTTTNAQRQVPGDVLLHPVALAALATLLLNDHYLKHHLHGFVPGKVSDVAGLVVFPLLAVAVIEGARKLVHVEAWRLSTGVFAWLIAITGLAFALVKLSPAVADAYSSALGVLAYLPRAFVSGTSTALRPIRVRADLTDLIALPALLVAWFVGNVYRGRGDLNRRASEQRS